MRFLSGAMYRQRRSDLFAETAFASDKMVPSHLPKCYCLKCGLPTYVSVDYLWTKFSFAPKSQRFSPYMIQRSNSCGGCPTVHVNPCIHQIWSQVQKLTSHLLNYVPLTLFPFSKKKPELKISYTL